MDFVFQFKISTTSIPFRIGFHLLRTKCLIKSFAFFKRQSNDYFLNGFKSTKKSQPTLTLTEQNDWIKWKTHNCFTLHEVSYSYSLRTNLFYLDHMYWLSYKLSSKSILKVLKIKVQQHSMHFAWKKISWLPKLHSIQRIA